MRKLLTGAIITYSSKNIDTSVTFGIMAGLEKYSLSHLKMSNSGGKKRMKPCDSKTATYQSASFMLMLIKIGDSALTD